MITKIDVRRIEHQPNTGTVGHLFEIRINSYKANQNKL
jgi:hypothetical protein